MLSHHPAAFHGERGGGDFVLPLGLMALGAVGGRWCWGRGDGGDCAGEQAGDVGLLAGADGVCFPRCPDDCTGQEAQGLEIPE